jgi:hypothetical protein
VREQVLGQQPLRLDRVSVQQLQQVKLGLGHGPQMH